jgi:hypothetical protein
MYTSHHIYLTEKLFKVHEPSNKVGGFLGDPFKKNWEDLWMPQDFKLTKSNKGIS